MDAADQGDGRTGRPEARQFRDHGVRRFDLGAGGRLDLDVLVDRTRPLDELPAALDDLAAGRVLGRTVITL